MRETNMKMEHDACLELALEGEILCKNGDFSGGVAFFEAAIRVGTEDLKTLSAVYSQLGNAYFYLGDYSKAIEYHRCDLTVARAIGDELGEGKASGNLGNTLKVLGKYDEAITCCERHLIVSKKLRDKVGEGRALYNLGNVYHAKGKRFAHFGHQDPGEFPEDVKQCLQKAVEYYEQSLKIMLELEDRSAQGRACGNLGNTHYLLGNFTEAITYHEERMKIAKEYRDLAAQRRAHNNLGNAHIFLGQFETAAAHYKKTLAIAIELSDQAVEAQACYSLGNTYTLLHDYPMAIDYHLRHLRIAQQLSDRIGEGRAYWSLGNAHSAIGNHEQALHYAGRHLEVSKEIGDQTGEITAQLSISDIQKVLDAQDNVSAIQNISTGSSGRMRRISMEHMDLLKLTPEAKVAKASSDENGRSKLSVLKEDSIPKGSTEKKRVCPTTSIEILKEVKVPALTEQNQDVENSNEQDSFFDLLSRFQSKRMDDQRCALVQGENKENNQLLGNRSLNFAPSTSAGTSAIVERAAHVGNIDRENNLVRDDLFDLIAGMQSRRLDEQRVSLPQLPGIFENNYNGPLNGPHRAVNRTCSNINNPITTNNQANDSATNDEDNDTTTNNNNRRAFPIGYGLHRPSTDASSMPDDEFFDMLMRCQASRIEDQRSTMPDFSPTTGRRYHTMDHCNGVPSAPTVPDEDFFSLIQRVQASRIEDQRSVLPALPQQASSGDSSRVVPGSSTGRNRSASGSSKPGSFRSSLKLSSKGSFKR